MESEINISPDDPPTPSMVLKLQTVRAVQHEQDTGQTVEPFLVPPVDLPLFGEGSFNFPGWPCSFSDGPILYINDELRFPRACHVKDGRIALCNIRSECTYAVWK